MKRYSLFLAVIVAAIFQFNCASDSLLSQEEEREILDAEKMDIEAMVADLTCVNDGECFYIAFGSKACGGPKSYLIYNSSVNMTELEEKVLSYNEKENLFNQKWGIVSDCLAVQPPNRVECVDGTCTAFYN